MEIFDRLLNVLDAGISSLQSRLCPSPLGIRESKRTPSALVITRFISGIGVVTCGAFEGVALDKVV